MSSTKVKTTYEVEGAYASTEKRVLYCHHHHGTDTTTFYEENGDVACMAFQDWSSGNDLWDAVNRLWFPFKGDWGGELKEGVERMGEFPWEMYYVDVTFELRDYVVKMLQDRIFIFGDNIIGKGKAGQAIIRDEPNAFGIPTKKYPSMKPDAFFNDEEYESNIQHIEKSIERILADGRRIIFPQSGIGTGLARMKELAPKTFDYLCRRLKEAFGFDNETGVVIKKTLYKPK